MFLNGKFTNTDCWQVGNGNSQAPSQEGKYLVNLKVMHTLSTWKFHLGYLP